MGVVADWLARFSGPVPIDELRTEHARAAALYLERHGGGAIALHERRRGDETDLLVVDVTTGAPQRPRHPIRARERVGLLFLPIEGRPLVMALRDDFPDTEHQLLPAEGSPPMICIDDRAWVEAQRTWTPAELVKRIVTWFERTALGELHQDGQPVEPLLLGSPLRLLVPRSLIAGGDDPDDLIGVPNESRTLMEVREVGAEPVQHLVQGAEPISVIFYDIPAERMRRLKMAPTTFVGLRRFCGERGVDLLADLRTRLTGWIAGERAWSLHGRVAILLRMSIMRAGGKVAGGVDLRAFIMEIGAGELAVALGVAERSNQGQDAGSLGRVGYVQRLPVGDVDDDALGKLKVQHAEVHLGFDADLAAHLTGRQEADIRRVVLIGAGAIGSHVAACLAREGRFRWTVVDDDILLPHNLARHTSSRAEVGRRKAEIVAEALTDLAPDASVTAIHANAITPGDEEDRLQQAFDDADLVIDATASVAASRHLASRPGRARLASVFFNPTGRSAVLLLEPADRSATLHDLEAQYMALLLRDDALWDHLEPDGQLVAYTGACRALTSRIPESRVMALSGLVAGGLGRAVDEDAAQAVVWRLADDGAVSVHRIESQPVVRATHGGWMFAIDGGVMERLRELRASALPREAGGLLFGLVDIPLRCIHVVEVGDAPMDSRRSETGFERGLAGVDERIAEVGRRTGGQVTYLGEWHSHPPGASADPSAIDAIQLSWLSSLADLEGIPTIMVIVAEDEVRLLPVGPSPRSDAA